MRSNSDPAENFNVIRNLVTDYGDVLRIWIGPDLNVFLSNPKDVEVGCRRSPDAHKNKLINQRSYRSHSQRIKVVLSSSKFINKSGEYKYIKPWLQDGLLLSDGQKWFQRRKILTPAFHFKILEQFVEIFDRQSDTMVETLAKFSGTGQKCEMYPIGTLYALDVICGERDKRI